MIKSQNDKKVTVIHASLLEFDFFLRKFYFDGIFKKQISLWGAKIAQDRGMEPISKRILINPSFKVSDDTIIKEREGCCSMHGFSAIVPRSKEIVVSFISEDGKQVVWRAKDWTARVLQHEIEHLEGKVFIDKMENDTLMFNYWQSVNARSGQFYLGFGGMKPVNKFFAFFLPKMRQM